MTELAQTVATTENANRWAVRKKKIRTVAIFALFARVAAQKVNGKKFNKTGVMRYENKASIYWNFEIIGLRR